MARGYLISPDEVGLTLVQDGHEALQLLAEAGPHAIQLVGALTSPGHARGRASCCAVNAVCVLKQLPTCN